MRIALMLLAATTALCGQDHVSAGAKIFRSHCAECHGLKGEGGRGPNLTTGVFFHGSTDADLMRNVADGIPGTAMPGVFFSPVQVSHLIAYVRSLSQSGGATQPPGDPANGAKLFREKGCIECHQLRFRLGSRDQSHLRQFDRVHHGQSRLGGADTVQGTAKTAWGTSPGTTNDYFTYQSPVIKSFTPAVGPTIGNMTVNITGVGLTDQMTVNFGGAHAPASHEFSFALFPTVTGVSPNISAPAGTTVQIYGN